MAEIFNNIIKGNEGNNMLPQQNQWKEGEPLFGKYRHDDMIDKCCEDLWNGPNAPFASRWHLLRFRQLNPKIFKMNNDGKYVAKAGDILNAIHEMELRYNKAKSRLGL